MPRRPKPEDIDFEIHIDPSCLSATHDEPANSPAMSARPSLSGEEARHEEVMEELESQIREHLDQAFESATTNMSAEEPNQFTEQDSEDHKTRNDLAMASQANDATNSNIETPPEDTAVILNAEPAEEPEESTAFNKAEIEASVIPAQNEPAEVMMQSIENDGQMEPVTEAAEENEPSPVAEGEENCLMNGDMTERPQTPEPTSRRESRESMTSTGSSPRRASGRTEALIQAAARDIVAQIEQGCDLESANDGETSFVSDTETVERSRISEAYTMTESRRSSEEGLETEQVRSADDGAENSSNHENEDDVFSDPSPRSSVGSASEAAASDAGVLKMGKNVTRRSVTRSSRMSGVSGFSQYEEDVDDFVPTIRGTPRPAFRSPSSVKAMQMSSPTPSVFGSPRSSRRTPLHTVSRLGSPGVSAQYSPKKTPPRFKRNTPPLVLLHVTLLPLRWVWGDVLDDARDDELSSEGKNLRDAWRQLQDRMGDTTCERGILLPHPQNDYEVLEERLLEALELPMRRRARILECGHYLGPANEMAMLEDESDADFDDDEDANFIVHSGGNKIHWCSTCRSDIRYDSLGAGKVFRVKVYASNGLMKAGAWDTCWKEMERVDVEIEPLVELSVQHELAKLQAELERRLDEQHAVELRHSHAAEEEYKQSGDVQEDDLEVDEEQAYQHELHEEPQPKEEPTPRHSPDTHVPPLNPDEARRLRDEERLREIYGHASPATHPEPDSPDPSFTAHGSPPSPSVEAFERRQERARTAEAYKTASLPELLFESIRVLMQDRKNVIILVMGLLVGFLALKGDANNPRADAALDIERLVERREAASTTRQAPPVILQETIAVLDEPTYSSVEAIESVSIPTAESSSADPCSSSQPAPISVSISREVIRVVETVTETAVETATVTETFTVPETTESVNEASLPSASAAAPGPEDIEPVEEEAVGMDTNIEIEQVQVDHATTEDDDNDREL